MKYFEAKCLDDIVYFELCLDGNAAVINMLTSNFDTS
jgi:hypothetical protein